jgi:hypothetical protein
MKSYLDRFVFCWDGPKLDFDVVLLFAARPRLRHRCDWVVAVDHRDGEAGLSGLCDDVTWRWLVAKIPRDTSAQSSSSTDLSRVAMVEEHMAVAVLDADVKEMAATNIDNVSLSFAMWHLLDSTMGINVSFKFRT